jgi:hypothetical protein
VDLGRAYYIYIVVNNMAGEGATYASIYPGNDYQYDQSSVDDTFQGRAANVAARALGGVIARDPQHIDPTNNMDVTLTEGNGVTPLPLQYRCANTQFKVNVAYHVNDLFFPGILGFQSLTIAASEETAFATSANYTPPAPTPTPSTACPRATPTP